VSNQLGVNGVESDAFIVWMTIAPLPKFRKLYGKIEGGLPAGKYLLEIDYEYIKKDHIGSSEHRKSIVLSTTSVLGGKNSFLSHAFVVVGFISLILGLVLIVLFLKVRKRRSRVSSIPLPPQPPPEPPEEEEQAVAAKPRTSTSSLRSQDYRRRSGPHPTTPPSHPGSNAKRSIP